MSKKIPAIPPATNIQDRAARDAIQALTEGWQLRNGMTGSGDEAFVTSGEVEALIRRAEIAKSKPSMDSGSTGVVAIAPEVRRSPAATSDSIMVKHPFLRTITLQRWLDECATYLINENVFLRNELNAIKARLEAGGL